MLPNPIIWNIHMYGVMMALGILAAFSVLSFYAKKCNVDEKFTDFVFFNGIGAIAAGLGSAALFQAVYNYIEHPERGFKITGNITFIGGLIGGVVFFLAVYFILRPRLTGRVTQILSIAPCCITAAHALGRIGCFFAGCCYGKPTDSFLGVKFPHLFYPVHPTQLYEAAFLFLLFGVCSYLLLKKKFQHNMSLYLVAYGIFRFCLEFLRGDARGELVAGISPSQFWSIAMVLVGIAMYFPLQKIFAAQKAAKEKASVSAEEAPAEEVGES